jgi:hypothetical protein
VELQLRYPGGQNPGHGAPGLKGVTHPAFLALLPALMTKPADGRHEKKKKEENSLFENKDIIKLIDSQQMSAIDSQQGR